MSEKHIESKYDGGTGVGRKHGQFGEKTMAEMTEREARQAVYRGVTVSDLEVIFRMDRRTILKRIHAVQPTEKRGVADCWAIRDVAPYLVKPAGDMEEYIKRMRPQDLPPTLQKEYWNALRSRQIYLENEEQLWRTDKVVSTLAEVFKTLRTNLLLLPDELDRVTLLSDKQRDVIKETADRTLEILRDALVSQFGGEPDSSERPGSQPPSPERDDTFDWPGDDHREDEDVFSDDEEL